MAIRVDFSKAIFKWQARHGEPMSYERLAKDAGINYQTLMHMKSKRIKKVDFEKLDALCKVLECEPGDLVIRVPDEPES